MSRMEMNNVGEKLSEARKTCVGMSEEMYLLTDYMSTVVNDTLEPMGLAVSLACVMDDILLERNGYGGGYLEKVKKHKDAVMAQIPYFPQVIDEIAEPEFAEEFRAICKEVMDINPPKRVKAEMKNADYPEYVKVAVDWWGNAIISPKFDNGTDMVPMMMFLLANLSKTYTENEIREFKEFLAKGIMLEVEEKGTCYLDIDYSPMSKLLAEAGELIGVPSTGGWPCKTNMRISKEEVTVSEGYAKPYIALWTKK